MKHKIPAKLRSPLILVVTGILLLIAGCFSLPEGETPVMSDLDAQLCTFMTQSLQDTVDTVVRNTYISVTAKAAEDLDSLWYTATDVLIDAYFNAFELDTLMRVNLQADSAYATLVVPGSGDDIVLVSDNYIVGTFLGKQTTYAAVDSSIALPTVVECYDGIKTRLVFDVPGGTYLIRITSSDATTASTIRLVIHKEQSS